MPLPTRNETLSDKTVKEPKGYASYAIWVSLSILVIALDQLTKWVIIKWVELYDKVPDPDAGKD